MEYLIGGMGLFFLAHFLPSQATWRTRIIGQYGEGPYKALFSIVSLAGLILIVIGYARAPDIEIWHPPYWMRHVTMMFMLPVFPLMIEAYLPGQLKTKFPHPMLLGVKIWAFAHLISNGDLASSILFGGFLIWAIYVRVSLKQRDAALGRPVISGPQRNDWIALTAGLAIYAYIVIGGGHGLLIGVPLAAVPV